MAKPPAPPSLAVQLAIGVAGCAVIAFTSLDVVKRMSANDRPPTEAEVEALASMIQEARKNSSRSIVRALSGEGRDYDNSSEGKPGGDGLDGGT